MVRLVSQRLACSNLIAPGSCFSATCPMAITAARRTSFLLSLVSWASNNAMVRHRPSQTPLRDQLLLSSEFPSGPQKRTGDNISELVPFTCPLHED